VVVYLLYGQEVVSFLCEQFNIPCFILKERPGEIILRRWDLDRALYYELYRMQRSVCMGLITSTSIPGEMHNGVITTFLLLCDLKTLMVDKEFYVNRESFLNNSVTAI